MSVCNISSSFGLFYRVPIDSIILQGQKNSTDSDQYHGSGAININYILMSV